MKSPPHRLNVGFMPLLDCATLVVAAELGFAAAEGLELRLLWESSWANIRDRVAVGHFDAAQMLGPMVVAANLGIGSLNAPLVAPVALGLGGNTITVSGGLWSQMSAQGAQPGAGPLVQGQALARVIRTRAGRALPPLTFAMVYPFSCHNYELRYWLAACGVDPDRDVRVTVLPPPLLVDALRTGQIDGFCVGEPWGSLAVDAGIGCIATVASEIWPLGPEKVLGCRRDWAERHPDRLACLIRAVHAAALWCDEPSNRGALARMLSKPCYVGAPASLLEPALDGRLRMAQGSEPSAFEDFLVFARHYATVPWPEHAAWYYTQMLRWGQLPSSAGKLSEARAAFRPDLYSAALAEGGSALSVPDRLPAAQGTFFDGNPLDP